MIPKPRMGQLEADFTEGHPPLIGTTFEVTINGQQLAAKVLNVSRINPPQVRTMGPITMRATHLIEFVVP